MFTFKALRLKVLFHPYRILNKSALILTLFFYLCFNPASAHCDAKKAAANIGSVLSSMINGTATFPPRFGINKQPVIKDPDIRLSFKSSYLNKVIAAYLKNPIALDSYSGKPKSFITVHSIVTYLDPKRNIIIIKGQGGVLTLGTSLAGLSGKLVLKRAEFEIAPTFSRNKNGQLLLEFVPRCVYLDIDRTAPFIDLSIAHTLQELYFNRKPINPVNVSDLLNTDVKGGKKPLVRNRIAKAAVIVTKNDIEVRAEWVVD
ncbi:MAG: hypothetical protein WC799_24500 [Desulfobacteraceae bacterium]|jgi:hypothetical protein